MSSLLASGLKPRWVEESHVLAGSAFSDMPGLTYTWPPFSAPSALRWLQDRVTGLRYHEREWLLLAESVDEGVAWSVLASAAGVGRYNRLPQARLEPLIPFPREMMSSDMWNDWLSQHGLDGEGSGSVKGLDMPETPPFPLPAGWAYTAISWPNKPLPALLNAWAEHITRREVEKVVLVSEVQSDLIGLVISPV
ncbi:hypothetical protein [Thermanaerothrix sp.]|uniref:hypothetical protein n=1 Tax=Thermanaerothrix sp. TaxID=2972675 RepID=UPI003C7D64B5